MMPSIASVRRLITTTALLCCFGTLTLAGDLEHYFQKPAPGQEAPARWYIAGKDGPLVGSQNFWFVTPHDALPGGFNMGGKVVNARGDEFEITPNSVWGKYTYRVTRLAEEKQAQTRPHNRPNVSSREIRFGELGAIGERTLLINGTIKNVFPDSKGFEADVEFAGGPLPLRFDVIRISDEKPLPDVHSRHYGPHWHHTFDVYYPDGFKPAEDKPLPVLMNIHGGGWGALDKGPYDARGWNDAGFAVISLNYRFVSEYTQHPAMTLPVAAPLLDAARALQFIKYHAKELGIDPNRICLTGGSAGGATTCWLAMHDDLADPNSPDPIARISTRVAAAAPVQAQTSLDPAQMRQWIPQITYGSHAFFTGDQMKGVPNNDKTARFEFFLKHREEILPHIKAFSAFEHASKDDPPMLHIYGGQEDVIPAKDDSNATHHPKFGQHLHERLKSLGVESHYWADNVKCDEPRYHGWPGMRRFVMDKLKVEPAK